MDVRDFPSGSNGSSHQRVLVTGGSGFIGSHCILKLIAAGYQVRTTVRSPRRESELRSTLKIANPESGDSLSFAIADLMSDHGWAEAVSGCDYVLHIASPFPPGVPRHEEELIIPAREGALRVLRAARDAGVKRVVLTSSFAAIGYGHAPTDQAFTEETWTDPDGPNITAYVKSKTLAEKAAWDFMRREGGIMQLSVVNPVGVLGPVLGPDYSASIHLVKRLMDGSMPGCPRLSFGIVDVRDVADLHLRAMTHPAAAGGRFLAISGNFMSIQEIAGLLRSRLGAAANRVPTRLLPNWVLRLSALFDSSIAQVVPELGRNKNASSAKAIRELGWNPRPREEAILATAISLVSLGLLRTKARTARSDQGGYAG